MLLEGQPRLSNIFENMTLQMLPQAFILQGTFGCGKHTLSKNIATKFNLELIDITDSLVSDTLDLLANRPLPTLYVIDTLKLNEKKQNAMLKFVEEYKQNGWVCLLVENRERLLPTILNRCVTYTFDRYSKEFLEPFVEFAIDSANRELVLSLVDTVGKVNLFIGQDIKAIFELCDKVINKIKTANLSNALSITDKFNFDDDYDKINIQVFFLIMVHMLKELCIKDSNYLYLYDITNTYSNRLNMGTLKKKDLINNYLINLWG